MAGSFMQTAVKQVVDVTSFLKEAASGNGIKYRAEAGKQHRVYIPSCTVETEVDGVKTEHKQIIALKGKVHDWTSTNTRHMSTVCLEGVVRKADDGTVLNNGACPFCKRVPDAWDIYNYRYQMEEETCQLQGDLRKKHLENCKTNFADERKAKDASDYMYMLAVQFNTTDDGQPILTSGTQLPSYELKIMKLSTNRVEKIQKQCKNSGADMLGSEIIFDYPAKDDIRQVVGESTISPVVIESAKFTSMYPAIVEQIEKDVEKFTWDGLEGAFPEWKGMTNLEAEEEIEKLFHKWDEYQQAKLINPNAKYMEYAYQLQTNNPGLNPQVPSLNGVMTPNVPLPNMMGQQGVMGMPQVPNIPQVPNVPNTQQAQNIPGMPQQTQESAPVQQTQNIPGMPQQTQNIPGMPQQTQNIPGMPQQTQENKEEASNTQGIPGMPQQTQENNNNGGVAVTANQLLGNGPGFVY